MLTYLYVAEHYGVYEHRHANTNCPPSDTESIALGPELVGKDFSRDQEGDRTPSAGIDEVEQEQHGHRCRSDASGYRGPVKGYLVKDCCLSQYQYARWTSPDSTVLTMRLTKNRPAAPPIRQIRRPILSTNCADIIVPTIPIVLRPPARPFCLRVL